VTAVSWYPVAGWSRWKTCGPDAETEKVPVPDEVLAFIAKVIPSNIRELEGALIRVLAHASINGQPVTLETAQLILRDIIPVQDTIPVSIEQIQDTVADHYADHGRADRHTHDCRADRHGDASRDDGLRW